MGEAVLRKRDTRFWEFSGLFVFFEFDCGLTSNFSGNTKPGAFTSDFPATIWLQFAAISDCSV